MITRPPTVYDDAKHTYTLNGEKLESVSGIAKVGGALEAFGIASAWGFRIGYEGAVHVVNDRQRHIPPFVSDEMRVELKKRGLTPWSKRNKAADRGNWVHDTLESLAQKGAVMEGPDGAATTGATRSVVTSERCLPVVPRLPPELRRDRGSSHEHGAPIRGTV